MIDEQVPVPVSEPEWDRGLWAMVAASGVLHLLAIALVLIIPHTFLHRPPALKSYTVDLIAPDHVGGTNMIAGGKGRTEGQPMAAAPKVEAPKPPPPKVEQPKPPEPKAEEPKVEPPKPEPPKPEPQKVEPPKAPPPEEAKPEAKPQPPKPEPPHPNEAVLAEKAKPAPPPPPKPAPAQPQPPKAVAKAEPPKPSKAEAKAAADAAKAAEKATKEAAAAKARDDQIQAAIRRVEQQAGKRGAGTGTKAGEQPGGPISVGPGEGAGGTVKGVEYLLYYNQMINRIKQVWAWAGANQALEATVGFSITESGDIVNVRIKQPSGDAGYDASVERAVRAANPLPPPPEGYRKEFSDVEITFSPKDLAG